MAKATTKHMNFGQRIAKNFKEVYFGGNWTASNIQKHLKDITWEEATTKVYELNTIAILLNHIHYYVRVATKVLEGGPLVGKDAESFGHEPIGSEEDWKAFQEIRYTEANNFISLLEQVSDDTIDLAFGDEKWGNYYRNLYGIVEHTHYHLGQIILIKKILRAQQ